MPEKPFMDTIEIMNTIPHRYPFLMLDKVDSIVPGERIIATKNITINEPFFEGHFPAKPIMPGVMIIEAMAQAAGIMLLQYMKKSLEDKESIIYLMSIEKAHFRQPALPGDTLSMEVSKISSRASAWKCYGEAKINNVLTADATFIVGKARDAK